ncbi:MAG: CHAT domain-containing protein [Pyrinomonadaceae bacterium]
MRYRDFDLKLYGGRTEGYYVEVVGSPVNRRSEAARLILPRSTELEPPEVRGGWAVAPVAPESPGRALFGALFPEPIRRLWERSEATLGEQEILRLRLDIRAPELAALPWESIHDGSYHLALSPRHPVVRFFFDGPEVFPEEIRGPLNLLLAVSTPNDAPPLPAVEEELKLTRESLDELKRAGRIGHVKVMRGASLRKLQAELRKRPYHVLHYVGHGEFAEDAGHLVLEDERGGADMVSALRLSYFLRDTPIRLLFLNACRTAIPSTGGAPLGVAQAALNAGVPAVVAMQDIVRDDLAACFAREFYQALADGSPLEACVAEGRKAIFADLDTDGSDWAIPTLFSNAREGLLWKTPAEPDDDAETAEGVATEAQPPPDKTPASKYNMTFGTVNADQLAVGDGNTLTHYGSGTKGRKRGRGVR